MTYTRPSSSKSLIASRYRDPSVSVSRCRGVAFGSPDMGVICEATACCCKSAMASNSFFRPFGERAYAMMRACNPARTASGSKHCNDNIFLAPSIRGRDYVLLRVLSQLGESRIITAGYRSIVATYSTGGRS